MSAEKPNSFLDELPEDHFSLHGIQIYFLKFFEKCSGVFEVNFEAL